MIDINTMQDKQVDNYRITGHLGKGGMGVVFTAMDTSLHRKVALKFLPEGAADNEVLIKRFVREARSSARLNHTNIVTVFGVGQYERTYYIAMELVPGLPLDALIRQEGRLPIMRALNITRQTADALAAAHAEGIVHRDVKPQNIIIGKSDHVKIMDFGLAIASFENTALTADGTSLGTPDYMSPEQWSDSKVDGRSDIFSLGVTLVEMLTGRLPFRASTPLAIMRKVVETDAPDVREFDQTIPAEVAHVIDLMLQKEAVRRYPSAAKVSADIEQLMTAMKTSSAPSNAEPFSTPGSDVMRANMDSDAAQLRDLPTVSNISEPSQPQQTGDFIPESEPTGISLKVKIAAGCAAVLLVAMTAYFFMRGGGDYIYVDPGTFLMGSPPTEEGRNQDEAIHEVTLTKGFWISKYEVTQKQWQEVMGSNPSYFKGESLPVEQVSWDDVHEFIRKLNASSGENYRLPTEAEWEYASRAGSREAYSFGSEAFLLSDYGWYADNSGGQTHPVGTAKPNALGLYDMAGNVWEFCEDWGAPYPSGSIVDPRGPVSRVSDAVGRIGRGGGWNVQASFCRSADRNVVEPVQPGIDVGFRLVHD